MKEVWVAGEEFVRSTFKAFKDMRALRIQQKKQEPYLFSNYNVFSYCAEVWSNTRPFLARIVNVVVKGLNEDLATRYYLPRYVIIMLDKDLINNIGLFDYGESRSIEDTLKWLLININRVFELRKTDLLAKKVGAVSSSAEPRLIWVTLAKKTRGHLRETNLCSHLEVQRNTGRCN